MNCETENIEFKSQFTEEIYKEVIAFANTAGGVIYVGVDNQGRPVGLSAVDDTCTRITNGVRDAITPDVTMFVHYSVREDQVIQITVGEGANKPYYLKSKGLKPTGVYIRQGTSSAPASGEQIRQMIKNSDGGIYEEMRSLEQALSFHAARDFFEKYHVEFGAEKYAALGMVLPANRLYTNLAQILSDQCAHTVKVAVFGDEANTAFKDRKEFSGSVFRQLEDTFQYLTLCSRTPATFRGLERIEQPDYPEAALREALLNAIVHRDYGFSGSIIINVNEKEMEFISLGGLVPGLSAEDIRSGISLPRNRHLADVFYRLHLIESYGTGIRKIFSLYADCPRQPSITITQNTFKITLPNMNTAAKALPPKPTKAPARDQQILAFIEQNGRITDEQAQALLGLQRTRCYSVMKHLSDAGIITAVGRGKNRYYTK